MYFDILLLLTGLFILILGGDFLVKGASSIALRLRVTPLVVGLTIVAFGTSAPELLISVKSALSGSPDLTMGNVVGSNICNAALVLGVTALISPIQVNADSLKIDWPVAMGSSTLLYFIALTGSITAVEGIIFVCLLLTYIVFLIVKSRKDNRALKQLEIEPELEEGPSSSSWKDLIFIALGSLGLYYGAEWFVGGAKELAQGLGVQERIIGITVLALGTSLPELTTAIIASLKKETDLALGNVLGSNIFNVLSILGITSLIKTIDVAEKIVQFDMLWMLGITLALLVFMFTRRMVHRWEGGLLLSIYGFYIYLVIVS